MTLTIIPQWMVDCSSDRYFEHRNYEVGSTHKTLLPGWLSAGWKGCSQAEGRLAWPIFLKIFFFLSLTHSLTLSLSLTSRCRGIIKNQTYNFFHLFSLQSRSCVVVVVVVVVVVKEKKRMRGKFEFKKRRRR